MPKTPGLHSRKLDPYGARLYFATSPEAWIWLARRYGQPQTLPNSIGRTDICVDTDTSKTELSVWLDLSRHMGSEEVLRTCVHEAFHVATELLTHLALDTDRSGVLGEPGAYLAEEVAVWLHGRATTDAALAEVAR